ncbi:MAG: serine/threonine-protein kinase [Pedobacter sp.]|nr:serine/threonine-protein kinase [Pedobacter sp.]
MGQIVIPGYTLKRKLGQGGMAAVFLAVQESFGREVALKILIPSLAKEVHFAERFLREARTMASLTHPNIIVVHDVGIAGPLHYYAMACHNGGDLTQRIRSGGVSTQEALRITRQIAEALAYAHEQGIVHRDIKPDNILFRERDDGAVLTDFGIAKSLHNDENQLTQLGATVGTPKYMSPEQARGKKVDGRSDLYSLGCVLYEMLTGAPPFLAEEAVTLAIKHCQDPIPVLRTELSRFQPLLNSLLAKEPGQRPADGRELVTMLDALLNPLPRFGSLSSSPNLPTSTNDLAATQVSQPILDETRMRPAVTAATARANPPAKARPYKAFFRTEESVNGNILTKRYGMQAAFSCEDYEEYKAQLSRLQDELRTWLEKRGKRAKSLHLEIQTHPWILGRIREVTLKSRQENSPLSQVIAQAEVTLHLHAEDDPEGLTVALSGKDGKAVAVGDKSAADKVS